MEHLLKMEVNVAQNVVLLFAHSVLCGRINTVSPKATEGEVDGKGNQA